MIFPGFPSVLSFFQVFQVEWEPCLQNNMTEYCCLFYLLCKYTPCFLVIPYFNNQDITHHLTREEYFLFFFRPDNGFEL